MRIDAHHHFWKYNSQEYAWINDSMSVLRRDYLPQDLRSAAETTGITGVISVQARQSVEETEWLLQFAHEYDLVRGVVGWAPLHNADVGAKLEEWTHHGWLKSVRHVVQEEPAGFLDDARFNEGVAALARYDLAYDLLIYGRQLEESIRFVDRHPKIRIILDHIAKPTIAAGKFDDFWKSQLNELAKRPNVACKFSGVLTEVRDTTWDIEVIRDYWNAAYEAFGSERLMFGSDWPVCLLRCRYDQWVQTCEQLVSALSESEQESFWSRNAIHWYQL